MQITTTVSTQPAVFEATFLTRGIGYLLVADSMCG
jgi:hypothetical protein